MKISIVIPNYNGSALIKKNIPRLIDVLEAFSKRTGHRVEVLIVDDCSSDDSREIIAKEIARYGNSMITLTLLENETNKGFSPTVNKGASHATGEILILLNTDVYPKSDFISPILPHFINNTCFAVGFMDESVESGKVVLRGRGLGKWEKGFLHHRKGDVDHSSTLWVNGGSGAFRKNIWDKLSGLDELYAPFYWEDIDISYRGIKAGYDILFEKKAVVVHEHEKGSIAKTYTPSHVKVIAYRNQIMFTWLNTTDFSLLLSHVFWLPVHVVKSLLRFDFLFIQGLIRAFLLLPKIIQSRNRRLRFFIRTDDEVIQTVQK